MDDSVKAGFDSVDAALGQAYMRADHGSRVERDCLVARSALSALRLCVKGAFERGDKALYAEREMRLNLEARICDAVRHLMQVKERSYEAFPTFEGSKKIRAPADNALFALKSLRWEPGKVCVESGAPAPAEGTFLADLARRVDGLERAVEAHCNRLVPNPAAANVLRSRDPEDYEVRDARACEPVVEEALFRRRFLFDRPIVVDHGNRMHQVVTVQGAEGGSGYERRIGMSPESMIETAEGIRRAFEGKEVPDAVSVRFHRHNRTFANEWVFRDQWGSLAQFLKARGEALMGGKVVK